MASMAFLGAMLVAIAATIILPYVKYNNLLGADAVGHLASIVHFREHIFPYPTGWNAHHFAGFPQYVFYPPLFHYLAALAAGVLATAVAFKLLVSVSVLGIPLAAYALGRRLGLGQRGLLLWLVWVWAMARLTPPSWGGNISGAIYFGQVSNTLAIPLFFLYLVAVERMLATRRTVGASLLLAATILAHTYTGLAAILILIGRVLVSTDRSRVLIPVMRHMAATLAVSAFWVVPVLVYREFMSGETITSRMPTYWLPIVSIGLILLFVLARQTDRNTKVFGYLIGLILLIGLVYIRVFSSLAFHPHRFFIYGAYLVFLPVYSLVLRPLARRMSPVVLVVLAVVFVGWTLRGVSSEKGEAYVHEPLLELPAHGPLDVSIEVGALETGRLLCTGNGYENLSVQVRSLSHQAALSGDNLVCDGLFMESALNASYLASIHVVMSGPADMVYTPKRIRASQQWLPHYLDTFNIQHVIGLHRPRLPYIKPSDITLGSSGVGGTESHAVYDVVASPAYVEVVDRPIASITRGWDEAVQEWWATEGVRTQLLVRTDEEWPRPTERREAKIRDYRLDRDGERMAFFIESEEDVPVLVKHSYFPNWKAYSGGRALRVYRTSPNLMLVYGRGDVELVYERSLLEKGALAVSVLCALALVLSVVALSARTHGVIESA